MTRLDLTALYVVGLIAAEALRGLWRLRRRRTGRTRRGPTGMSRRWEQLVLLAIAVGIWLLPLTYALTPWLHSFDYALPVWAGWVGASVFGVSLGVRSAAHRRLGTQWSGTLATAPEQTLVTDGIYAHARHPIYVSLVGWAAAQPLLLQNLLAGFGGAVAVALIWLVRVPREEAMMLERFGDAYRHYMAHTGRFLS